MTVAWAPPPFRIAFDNARDPYTARNALGITGSGGGAPGPPGPPGPTGPAGVVSTTPPLSLVGGTLSIDLTGYQPIDGDLTAISGLTGTNTIYYRSAANTWTPVNVSTGLAFSGGNLTATSAGGNVSNSGTPTVDQIAVWTDATHIKGIDAATLASQTINCGRLTYVSATALSFAPYHGDRIKIAGVIYAIPSGGIAGLTNGGLTAATTYYVYAFNSSGTITAEFSTTTHATSATAGNVGVEIKSGDNSRTLIGMVRTNASAQFQNTADIRWVISWFNRRNISLVGASTAGAATASLSPVELTSAARAYFLTWQEEDISMAVTGHALLTAIGNISVLMYLDATTNVWPTNPITTVPGASYAVALGGSANPGVTEGMHFITPMGFVSGGTGTYHVFCMAMIRG